VSTSDGELLSNRSSKAATESVGPEEAKPSSGPASGSASKFLIHGIRAGDRFDNA
jgi:hypothetical protein